MTDTPGIVESGRSTGRKAAPMESFYVRTTGGFYLVHALGRLVSPSDVVCGARIPAQQPGDEPLDLHCWHCRSNVRLLSAPGPDQPDEPVMVVDHAVSCPWLLAQVRPASSPAAPSRSA